VTLSMSTSMLSSLWPHAICTTSSTQAEIRRRDSYDEALAVAVSYQNNSKAYRNPNTSLCRPSLAYTGKAGLTWQCCSRHVAS